MGKYDILFKYIDLLADDAFGELFIDKKNDASEKRRIRLPYIRYTQAVNDFIRDIHLCWEKSGLGDYVRVLNSHGIEWSGESMKNADVDSLPADTILALLFGAVRAERFNEGVLMGFLKNGYIQKWLSGLKRKGEE